MKSRICLIALAVFIASCSGSKKSTTSVDIMKPTEADVQKQSQAGVTTDLASLETGYNLYTANCGKCHGLIPPPKKSLEQWDDILPKMFPKTKLTGTEQAQVKAYIVARR